MTELSRPSDKLSFEICPLSRNVGAEISGLDLKLPLTVDLIASLRKTWLEHGVLLFRDQELTIEDQIRFASYFGEPTITNRSTATPRPDRDPRILLISNIREDGKPIGSLPDGELQFHSDSAFRQEPLMATLLYSIEVPDRGGNTLFANANAAFDRLDADFQQRLEGLRAVNGYDYSTQVKKAGYDRESGPHAIHPVTRTHPETGRKAIYVNRLMTEEIIGLKESESREILEKLYEKIEDPDICYTHVWRPGDLLMWDNRCLQHARTDFPTSQRRLLLRVGLCGDNPF